jgi:hypothetical protein
MAAAMKKAVTLSLTLTFVLVGGVWFGVRPAYRRAKEQRLLKVAIAFAEKGDWRNASLSARQALVVNPRSVKACRLMAGLADRLHAPQGLDWQRRLAGLEPTVANQLALAQTAMRMEGPPFSLAAQVLKRLPAEATNSVGFQTVSAELALKLHRYPQAETCFSNAAILEPGNELHRLNLATVRLLSTNRFVSAEARAALEGFAARRNLAALRSLVADSLNRSNYGAALRYSGRLLNQPGATFEDRLEHLMVLKAGGGPMEQFLAALEGSAATNPAEIYVLSAWLTRQGRAGQALSWLRNCPSNVQARMPVPLACAEAFSARQDWSGLEGYLQQEPNWGEMEFWRLAWLARAAAGRNNRAVAEARWRLAERQAEARLGPLLSLLTWAERWQPGPVQEELLWRLIENFPRERWAVHRLAELYTYDGDTYGLYKLWELAARQDPRDLESRNNLAGLAMLLKLNLAKAHQVAKEDYAEHSQDPIIAATYGFSLHLQGRTAEGLGVFKKLPPAALKEPEVALYYGVLLAGEGMDREAAASLEIARGGVLLPEERRLLGQALKQE